jgi:hypothetical protein
MCCFSRRVDKVADTSIFGRASRDGRQFLVYSMRLDASEDLAMILPIPTPKDAAEDAVRFISLEDYPEFFRDLKTGFPEPPASRGLGLPKAAAGAKPHDAPLKVVEVGAFEASFVPSVKDFDRLDVRFRLPAATWDQLPNYKGFGFTVFKLKKGNRKIHPMAFEFPRANREHLFFPTVHIHDGKVHQTALFDHALYCQRSGDESLMRWRESPRLAGSFMKADKTKGIIDPAAHAHLLRIAGRRKNEDILV